LHGRLGRLAAWHVPGGPLGPASWWAAASKVEVGQTTYPANRGKMGKEGIEGSACVSIFNQSSQ